MPNARGLDAPWLPWSGITSETGPDCTACSWSRNKGRSEVKFVNRGCPLHGRRLELADKASRSQRPR